MEEDGNTAQEPAFDGLTSAKIFRRKFNQNFVVKDVSTHKAMKAIVANTYWWGGATKQADVQTLGSASETTSEANAKLLIGKWFLGTEMYYRRDFSKRRKPFSKLSVVLSLLIKNET